MAKRWPAVKKRTAAKSLDPLPGRKQCFGTALHKAGLGAARGNPDIGPRLQLEEVVALGGTGLSIGWPALPVMVSDPARQLQRREPHRLSVRSETALAGAEGDSDLGRFTGAQKLEDEAVPGEPEQLAPSGDAARLLTGLESGGRPMGQSQRPGIGQALCRWLGRSRAKRLARNGTCPPIHVVLLLLTPCRTLLLTLLSLYYARFSK